MDTSEPNLAAARNCENCGYSLAGLQPGTPCPECGVVPSEGEVCPQLHQASPEFLRALLRGLKVMVHATRDVALCAILLLVVASIALPSRSASLSAQSLIWTVGVIAVIGMSIGSYIFSTPSPPYVRQRAPEAARRWLRRAAVGTLACAGGAGALMLLSLAAGPASANFLEISLGLLLMLWILLVIVQLSALMDYISWLASRVPDPQLQKSARRMAWVLPVVTIALCGAGGAGLILAMIVLHQLHKHLVQALAIATKAAPPPGQLQSASEPLG